MNNRWWATGPLKGILRVVIILAVLTFWGAYLRHNWNSLLTYRWQLDLSWLVLACLMAIIFWATLAATWRQVLISVGGSLSLRVAVRLWSASMLGRYLPGGVWHVAARVYMAEKAGQSKITVFISTMIEQILALLSGMLILLASLPFWNANYGDLAPILVLILPLAVSVHPAVLRRLTSLAARFVGGGRKAMLGASFTQAPEPGDILSTPGYRSMLSLTALYALGNLIAASTTYFSAAAIGSVTPDQIPAFVGAYVAGFILGYFSFFAPSGLGVREGAIALLLSPIIGAPVAIAASVLSRVVLSLGEAIFLGLSWALGGRSVAERAIDNP